MNAEPRDARALTDRLHALAADADAHPLLVALDFDGTLAPLQDDPSASRILPAGVDALATLAGHAGLELALVSGRSMADLQALAQVPAGTFLIGSHGAERARVTTFGLDRDVVELTHAQADRLAALGARAAAVARGRDGVWVETKPTAVVVHTRLAEPDVGAEAEAQALALGTELGCGTLHGKDVVELTVLPADKGTALQALRGELGAPVVLYAGDDVTDEHAFAALGATDVTVKVGAGQTAAAYRVGSPDAVVAVLADLAATWDR
ncbi:trehalose-phosphatase [Cellulomonas oligotrophica]|uniref:Trehalose 6-phosphate phosphatase n=1 Tax=Cellulomonas oligotrophica TaxID=931536 RepID=A0A7Y9FH11_9CELL|nr:trehalose-phosphatase [Cellulomonas oligotrophica]NYD87176.1 trehalose 6-phosphate phosphatase [Cellulomonas oligotrophica]GIG33955.1 trehalose 6-phosphate phosphatase [Cellulomonas oligotrophica]